MIVLYALLVILAFWAVITAMLIVPGQDDHVG